MIPGAQNNGVSKTPLSAATITMPTISKRQRLFWIIAPLQELQIITGISTKIEFS